MLELQNLSESSMVIEMYEIAFLLVGYAEEIHSVLFQICNVKWHIGPKIEKYFLIQIFAPFWVFGSIADEDHPEMDQGRQIDRRTGIEQLKSDVKFNVAQQAFLFNT